MLRWAEAIAPFDIDISYRPGKTHQNADSMSRYPTDEINKSPDLTPTDRYHYDLLGIPIPKTGPVGRSAALTRRAAKILAAEQNKETQVSDQVVEALKEGEEAPQREARDRYENFETKTDALTGKEAQVVQDESDKEELPQ